MTIGFSELVTRIAADATGHDRFLVGLVGPPGSGKSTVAARLAAALGGVVVPMDGFHLDNSELERIGLADVKGAPDTFDGDGFVRLVELLRSETAVDVPSFDRVADRTVDAAISGISVTSADRIVIVEGNYLLLDNAPWETLRPLFDTTVYLDIADDVRIERLVARHVRHGRTPDAAREFVLRSDEANTAIVAASRRHADVILDPSLP